MARDKFFWGGEGGTPFMTAPFFLKSKWASQAARAAARHSKTKKDTFDLQLWWREATAKVPSWAYVLRAVLTNSPNSIPPERCFSILNDTFDDDQTRMVPTTSSTRSSRSTTRAAAPELVLPCCHSTPLTGR